MRLGVVLPNEAAGADPRAIADLARHAELLGFAGVWLPDHLLPPEPYGAVYGGVFEPLMLLAHIAAVTTRVTLGTSVLILPLRDPFLLAKQTATLERLAPGRVVLGVGVGWERSEFSALDIPFRERGARADEAIELLRRLHSTGHGHFAGRFHHADDGVFEPRPTAPIPLSVGGMSDAALRRAARVGDQWQAVGASIEAFRERRDRLRAMAGARRVRAGAVLADRAGAHDAAHLASLAAEWRDAGAHDLAIHFGGLEATRSRMAAFAESYGRASGHTAVI
jgi:probable F420-dependent oxidoreductase